MKCAACGYDDKAAKYVPEEEKPFIEVFGLTGGIGHYNYRRDGYAEYAEFIRDPVKAYACPICGTVKMEV